MTTITLSEIDLTDPANFEGEDAGFDVWGLLAREAPVFWNRCADRPGFWALTKYRHALAVYQDWRSFTSQRGMQVAQDEAAARRAAGKMLIVTDPPRHRQLRSVLSDAFTQSAVRRLEEDMRGIVADALTSAADRDEFDFVVEVASKLPMSVICALLGVPRADWEQMVEWTRTAFGSVAGDRDRDPVTETEKIAANADIFFYYSDLVAERRRTLTDDSDDLISILVRGSAGDAPLTDEEILLNIQGLITGGNETTRHSSAGAVIALIENPDEWERLKTTPSLLATAVEEVLRWTAPSIHVMRTALRDVTLGDQLIRAGEQVTIWNPAVNRDEDEFPEAHRFDVGRTPNRHLTFGIGHHFCIGAALARLELRVLLTELTARVSSMELAGPVKRLRSTTMWGVDCVPVQFEFE
ncbi:MAG TPA: cytochrome P450 [Gaiellaceae bacterium]